LNLEAVFTVALAVLSLSRTAEPAERWELSGYAGAALVSYRPTHGAPAMGGGDGHARKLLRLFQLGISQQSHTSYFEISAILCRSASQDIVRRNRQRHVLAMMAEHRAPRSLCCGVALDSFPTDLSIVLDV
jgi:hypothetical protein